MTPAPIYPVNRPNLAATLRFEWSREKLKKYREAKEMMMRDKFKRPSWGVKNTHAFQQMTFEWVFSEIVNNWKLWGLSWQLSGKLRQFLMGFSSSHASEIYEVLKLFSEEKTCKNFFAVFPTKPSGYNLTLKKFSNNIFPLQAVKWRRNSNPTCHPTCRTATPARRTRIKHGNDETACENSAAASRRSHPASTSSWTHLPSLRHRRRQKESQRPESTELAEQRQESSSQRKPTGIDNFHRQQANRKFSDFQVHVNICQLVRSEKGFSTNVIR